MQAGEPSKNFCLPTENSLLSFRNKPLKNEPEGVINCRAVPNHLFNKASIDIQIGGCALSVLSLQN